MALTPPQLSLHWREFAAAKRACLAAGHPMPDRHELYVKAGVLAGPARAKSLTKFNNGDLDKVLAAFRALSRPSDLEPQLNADRQVRIRLEYSIRDLASQITQHPVHLADPYWQAVYRDKFWGGGLNPSNPGQPPELALLSVPQLIQLRDTLEARLASKRRKDRPTSPARQTSPIPADRSELDPVTPFQSNSPEAALS